LREDVYGGETEADDITVMMAGQPWRPVMLAKGKARRIALSSVILLAGITLGSVGTIVVQRAGERTLSTYCMMMAKEAIERGNDLEAIDWLTEAQWRSPDWYLPAAKLADIFQRRGWSELSLHQLRRARTLMSAKGVRDDHVFRVTAHDQQEVDRKIAELEKQLEHKRTENQE